VKTAGDFRSADLHDTTRWKARRLFLVVVEDECPEVMRDLVDSCLPAYQEAFPIRNWEADEDEEPAQPEAYFWAKLIALQDDRSRPLETALEAWGRRYHVDRPWLYDVALGTLAKAAELGAAPASFAEPCYIDSLALPQFRFAHFVWVPTTMTWDEYSTRINEQFRVDLGAYRKRIQDYAREARLRPAKSTRKDGLKRHMQWFVRFQVLGHERSALAEETGVDRKTISDALQETAALIELPLRPAPRPGPRSKRRT
jgi:hypothetical protein